MSEQNKALFRQFIDGMNAHDLSVIDQVIDPSFVNHDPMPGQDAGIQGLKYMMAMFYSAFPDLTVTLEQIVAEGDLVVGRVVTAGTQSGVFMGIPGSDKKISLPEMHMIRVENGKAVEYWGVVDSGLMMQQLGVIPED
ncbi:MAG: ester cyclase [Chloroflexi bacterium]|nr:ester cyclase [Chloroflexota bacterium]